jgi:glutamate synthase (NADPH/NADH) large chain
MIAISLLVWYSIAKNKDVPTNGLVYPLGNVFFRIYARLGNVRSRPAPQGITGRSKKRMENFTERKAPAGLYDPRFEHDNCGIGAVVDIKGRKTHKTIDDALQIVEHLEHRAGKDAEGKTGDGVGILLQIGHKFFKKAAEDAGITLGNERDYGIGMFFFPQEELNRNQDKKLFEIICKKEGLNFLGWREVPTCPEILGHKARSCMPSIWQAFVERPARVKPGIDFDRKLYVARRVFEQSSQDTYVCSLSSRTIVYKGMFLVKELRLFYPDLQSEDYESAIGMVHSRFSTNTAPSWNRAHPNRFILHNGEINTIRGNVDTMLAREETIGSNYLKEDMTKVLPIVNQGGSDSAMLDNTLEFMVMNGMELPLAVMVTIPEPWENNHSMDPKKRAFYQYYATMLEPWDGPASILFSDGDVMGAVLDRNGLRPSRYYITKDGRLILSSEVGVLDIPAEEIVRKDRLRPGKMLLVDTARGELVDDESLKADYASREPYGEWLDRNLVNLADLKIPNERVPSHEHDELVRLQKAFGYQYEDVSTMILPMAKNGAEPAGAMGSDTPLAVLSHTHPPLFEYFKQMFAQVTNPPIDALREKVVTSTTVYVGAQGNLLEEDAENCKVLKITNPILTETDLMKIKAMKVPGFKVETISICYYKNTDLEKAIDRLFVDVDRAYRDGANILILSDREIDEYHVAIPSLLAVGAVSKYLVRTRKRTAMALILESGEPRKVHDFATLLGYGACAINPYLAQETIGELINEGLLDKDYYAAVNDYNKAVLAGIVKIASKMGISTIQSYQGSQIFEALGLSNEVVDKYFTNTVSRVGGITIRDIQNDLEARHKQAFDPLGLDISMELTSLGEHKLRSGKLAEDHLYNPLTIHLLQQACWTGDYNKFKAYTDAVNAEGGDAMHLRSLLDFNYPDAGIPLDEVESVDSIVHRFKTAAMSYGALSEEAHECMAVAMNRIGGKSNTGEGGEAEDRFGTERNSAIKQVASARFGVTSKYLVSASEIQIKMAQGAKPGEGGQLPGGKVYPWVAKTRHSTTGVGLISPPPHHDIYSIEDLAQLIYDLKCSNRKAAINVKLVSEAGVGTIAAGVVKAKADGITISGYDGGTGASPRTSMRHAGLPWEIGLSEVQQVLLLNQLRDRVKLETDGKLLTGRDVAIAALLGAERFSFCTGPLVALGCQMYRVCNRNTCPLGICTQDEKLRKRFAGKPEYLENFMRFVAEDLREIMARLGFRRLEDMVGRSDRLKQKGLTGNPKADTLHLDALLFRPYTDISVGHHFMKEQDHEMEKTLDMAKLVRMCKPALEEKKPVRAKLFIKNTNRVTGTIVGSEISRRYGEEGLPEDTIRLSFVGSAGQSFGAFIPKGLTLTLEGDANDYAGKGLSGGKIIIYPPRNASFKAEDNVIIGNVAFFGATGGKAFVSGRAGERFCVRNSGATVVVEGVGNHGLEYMTGGRAVILGPTGLNLAAGMSGGTAYVVDLDERKLNHEMVHAEPLDNPEEAEEVRKLIEEHYICTRSERAEEILAQWNRFLPRISRVIPKDYEAMEKEIRRFMKQGKTREEAEKEAFGEKFGK